jgi:hypothetical protein
MRRGSRLRPSNEHLGRVPSRHASLIHTDPDGLRDVAPGPHTRVYHFAGHRARPGYLAPQRYHADRRRPVRAGRALADLRGTVNYGRLLRACLVHLDAWVTEGVEPPPSRHPPSTTGRPCHRRRWPRRSAGFPARTSRSKHHARPRRLDFGADAELRVMGQAPPREGPRSAPTSPRGRGRQRDRRHRGARGQRPAGSHTGWTSAPPRLPAAPASCWSSPGPPSPFAATAAGARGRRRRPLSIEERYPSREAYLERVRGAARTLGGRTLSAGPRTSSCPSRWGAGCGTGHHPGTLSRLARLNVGVPLPQPRHVWSNLTVLAAATSVDSWPSPSPDAQLRERFQRRLPRRTRRPRLLRRAARAARSRRVC